MGASHASDFHRLTEKTHVAADSAEECWLLCRGWQQGPDSFMTPPEHGLLEADLVWVRASSEPVSRLHSAALGTLLLL